MLDFFIPYQHDDLLQDYSNIIVRTAMSFPSRGFSLSYTRININNCIAISDSCVIKSLHLETTHYPCILFVYLSQMTID